ncbi:MAG: DUF3016 domain-containing protein [Burkholderiaceae bacterium]|nr:DUF3016 domain-containing protein [Burkholderiaceae bacterium]
MNRALRTALAATLLAVVSAAVLVALARQAHAAGSADVRFVEPERYRDAGLLAPDRERTLATLAAHLKQLAQRLPDGRQLRIDVLDVDLAGDRSPRPGTDVRVLRGGADVPRLHLKWTLEEGGRTIKSGEDRFTDLGYLTQAPHRAAASGDLPYEKRLLTRWFDERFAAR